MKPVIVVALLLVTFISVTRAVPFQRGNGKLQPRKPVVQGGEDPDPEIRARRNFIKQMMKDSWDDYVRWAWGENELKPISQTGQSGGIFGESKIGATIVDSLDTLWIMELMDEYKAGEDYVRNELNFTANATVSVFEVNIRFVGGFLSAFALTQEDIYKDRAVEIAQKLLPSFNTPTGIPYSHINVLTEEVTSNVNSVLAEFGTLHLEFMYLSEITGDPIYAEKVQGIRRFLREMDKPEGLYYNHLNVIEGQFSDDHVSIGALGDSYYEYLLKAYIQLNDEEGRIMYDEAMDAFENKGLVKVSNQSRLLYIAELRGEEIQDVVGHLACFAGGMYALGAHVSPNNPNAARHAEIGRNFTNTCRESYIRTATQIGPEVFKFTDSLEAEADSNGRGYILRPEVIESYFVLYRVTGDPKYREWAWEAAQAIERFCKAGWGRGYSGIRNTNSITNPEQDDVQQTFFLAETLKYLYLIFSTNDLISIDEWVFNTECHPLPIKATNSLF